MSKAEYKHAQQTHSIVEFLSLFPCRQLIAEAGYWPLIETAGRVEQDQFVAGLNVELTGREVSSVAYPDECVSYLLETCSR